MFISHFVLCQIVALLVMGCASGFSTVPPSDTAKTNIIRRKVGIREIKPTWIFYGREFSEESWLEPGTKTGGCKRVHRNDDGTIKWEDDYYPGKKTFVDADGATIREHLAVHYDYLNGQFSIIYFGEDPDILALQPNSRRDVDTDNLKTLKVADKILAGWNMDRL